MSSEDNSAPPVSNAQESTPTLNNLLSTRPTGTGQQTQPGQAGGGPGSVENSMETHVNGDRYAASVAEVAAGAGSVPGTAKGGPQQAAGSSATAPPGAVPPQNAAMQAPGVPAGPHGAHPHMQPPPEWAQHHPGMAGGPPPQHGYPAGYPPYGVPGMPRHPFPSYGGYVPPTGAGYPGGYPPPHAMMRPPHMPGPPGASELVRMPPGPTPAEWAAQQHKGKQEAPTGAPSNGNPATPGGSCSQPVPSPAASSIAEDSLDEKPVGISMHEAPHWAQKGPGSVMGPPSTGGIMSPAAAMPQQPPQSTSAGPSSSTPGPAVPEKPSGGGGGGSGKNLSKSEIIEKLVGPVNKANPAHVMPERRNFFERLADFCEKHGEPIAQVPQVSKQCIDLHRLYISVRNRGGFQQVCKDKAWKALCTEANPDLSESSAAGYQLRKHYQKHLLLLECVETGRNMDDEVAHADKNKRQRKREAPGQGQAAQGGPPQGFPGNGAPPGAYPGHPGAHQMSDPNYYYQQHGIPPPHHAHPGYPPGHMAFSPGQYPPRMPPPGATAMRAPIPQHMSQHEMEEQHRQQWYAQQQAAAAAHHHQMQQQQMAAAAHAAQQQQQQAAAAQQAAPSTTPACASGPGTAPSGSNTQPATPGSVSQASVSASASNQPPTPAALQVDTAGSQAGSRAPSVGPGVNPAATPDSSSRMSGGADSVATTVPATDAPRPESAAANAGVPSSSSTPAPSVPAEGGPSTSTSAAPSQMPPHPAGGVPPPGSYYGQPGPMYPGGPMRPPGGFAPAPGTYGYPPGAGAPPHHPAYGQHPAAHPQHPHHQQYMAWQQRYQAATAAGQPVPGMMGGQPGVPPGAPGGPHPRQGYPGYPPRMPGVPPQGAPSPSGQPSTAGKIPQQTPRYPGPASTPGGIPPAGANQYPQPPSAQPPAPGSVQRAPAPTTAASLVPPPSIQPQQPQQPSSSSASQSSNGLPTSSATSSVIPGSMIGGQPAPPQYQFPPGSVEATSCAQGLKRRKMAARELINATPRRLIMALRSGLDAEAVWAINALTVLLHDDSNPMPSLQQMPGLVNVIVEHLFATLSALYPKQFELHEPGKPSVFTRGIDEKMIERLIISATTKKSKKGGSSEADSLKTTVGTMPVIPKKTSDVKQGFTMKSRNGLRVQVKDEQLPTQLKKRVCRENEESEFRWDDASISRGFIQERNGLGLGGSLAERIGSRLRAKLDTEKILSRSKFSKWEKNNNEEMNGVKTEVDEGFSEDLLILRGARSEELSDCKHENELGWPRPTALCPRSEAVTELTQRALALSNILRAFSFVPGSELLMGRHEALLYIVGRFLKLYVEEKKIVPQKRIVILDRKELEKMDMTESLEDTNAKALAVLDDDDAIKALLVETSNQLRDDAMVMLCHMSATLDLFDLPDAIAYPIYDGLIYWCVSSVPEATDVQNPAAVSLRDYALEVMCKMVIIDRNVDMFLSTGSWSRVEKMVHLLAKLLTMHEETHYREFAIVILNALCVANEAVCYIAAIETNAIAHLIFFIDSADQNMHQVMQQHGMPALRDNPEMMGTSVGMLRRAAAMLRLLVKVPLAYRQYTKHQHRLLQFTMSQLMDSRVAGMVADTLFEVQELIRVHGDVIPEESSPKESSEEVKKEEPDETDEKTETQETKVNGGGEMSTCSDDVSVRPSTASDVDEEATRSSVAATGEESSSCDGYEPPATKQQNGKPSVDDDEIRTSGKTASKRKLIDDAVPPSKRTCLTNGYDKATTNGKLSESSAKTTTHDGAMTAVA